MSEIRQLIVNIVGGGVRLLYPKCFRDRIYVRKELIDSKLVKRDRLDMEEVPFVTDGERCSFQVSYQECPHSLDHCYYHTAILCQCKYAAVNYGIYNRSSAEL